MPQNYLTKITAKRVQKNISQRYMAASLNISQGYYNKLENGKLQMSANMLFSIINILEIDPNEIFPHRESANQPSNH